MLNLKLFLFFFIELNSGLKNTGYKVYINEIIRTERSEKKYVSAEKNWNIILEKYLQNGVSEEPSLFNYDRLSRDDGDKRRLNDYIISLQSINPEILNKNEAITYYANLYNAVTVKLITDSYPIESIRKLGPLNSGPWKRKIIKLNGELVSLDDIEHKILRSKYRSPYIHYMLNCASISCPNLQKKAWKGETLKADQQRAAVEYINSSRGVTIEKDGLHLSSIYKWFKEDFKSDAGVLDHILKYADKDLKSAIEQGAKIRSYDYDWTLNDLTD
ncbi:DUF547 domain-containing protein [Hellea sp.]|nr:DUF547 domain-containing protein [Hellea sp.]